MVGRGGRMTSHGLPFLTHMVAPTPHRFQWGMLGYVGLIWFADAMELMMLSFIGPAVS